MFHSCYNFNFSCYVGKIEIGPLHYPITFTDANDTIETWSRYLGLALGWRLWPNNVWLILSA